MKKILSCILTATIIFVSGFYYLPVFAEELSTEQEETELIDFDEESISEQQEKTEMTDNDRFEVVPPHQEVSISNEVLNSIDSISSETEDLNEIVNNQLLEESTMPPTRVAADSEKPVIDTSSIWIDNTSVYYGDTVTIRVKVTDNDKLKEVLLNLKNDSSSKFMYYLKMIYNEEIDMYEYTLNVNTSISAGIWNIESVSAEDVTGNYISEYFNTSFTIINANADSEKPYIDVNSLSISKPLINENESLIVKVKITDNAEINRVEILFNNKEASNLSGYKEMIFNQNSDCYEYKFTANNQVPSGKWNIESITAYDKSGNSNHISFEPNEYTFTVNNQLVDSERPIIDKSSFSITPINAQTNDVITIQVKISDNTGIDRVTILLTNWDTMQNSGYLTMEYDSVLGSYKYSFVVDDSITVGHWTANITAYDSIGNYNSFGSYEDTIFFITDKGEDIHDWDEGIITKNSTTTEEGIKTYTCKLWACGMTKTESIPILSDNNNNNKPEEPSEKPPVSPMPDFDNNDNINNDNNNSGDNTLPFPSWWAPTTEEEKIRYECMGKENVQYTIQNNQPFNINIQNAMQGEKCFEVFRNVTGDYTIARTYNIFPLITTQKYSTDEKVTLSLTIPEALCQENREFKLICVSQNGTPFIFEDQDEESNTITISTDKFYAYALVYRNMK